MYSDFKTNCATRISTALPSNIRFKNPKLKKKNMYDEILEELRYVFYIVELAGI